jgi:hypothetical protein
VARYARSADLTITKSILPAVVLHTGRNVYSNVDLWLHGQAEWQASSGTTELIWKTGADASFWLLSIALFIVVVATLWAYFKRASRQPKDVFALYA